jgi:predicted transcriptional regulator
VALLRSRAQGDLLALLFLHSEREYSLTEAAALTGVSVKTIHTEASRLVAAGFVSDSRRGNMRARCRRDRWVQSNEPHCIMPMRIRRLSHLATLS